MIAKHIGTALSAQNATISTAESCTGGAIAHSITAIAGSSAYFKGALVAYANEIKQDILNVPSHIIETHGAVSRECVESMAHNCRKLFKTDYAVATSGIAGPGGGSVEKPVGTVWIAVATPLKVIAQRHNFDGNREQIVQQSVGAALTMMLQELVTGNSER